MRVATTASLNLIAIAAIWGATFPLIKNAVIFISPSSFVAIRFLLACLLLLPIALVRIKRLTRFMLISGVLIGLMNGVSYITQTIGLQTIDSSRAAFITGMNVIFVPFLMPLFKLGKPTLIDISSIFLCCVGLYVLTGATVHGFTYGDFMVLAAAFTMALTITYIQWSAQWVTHHTLLAFLQILFTWPIALIVSGPIDTAHLSNPSVLIGLSFCAIIATALALYLQIKYQVRTTATRASMIFMLEPVFASIFALLINGEAITPHVIAGGAIIFTSIGLSDILRCLKNIK